MFFSNEVFDDIVAKLETSARFDNFSDPHDKSRRNVSFLRSISHLHGIEKCKLLRDIPCFPTLNEDYYFNIARQAVDSELSIVIASAIFMVSTNKIFECMKALKNDPELKQQCRPEPFPPHLDYPLVISCAPYVFYNKEGTDITPTLHNPFLYDEDVYEEILSNPIAGPVDPKIIQAAKDCEEYSKLSRTIRSKARSEARKLGNIDLAIEIALSYARHQEFNYQDAMARLNASVKSPAKDSSSAISARVKKEQTLDKNSSQESDSSDNAQDKAEKVSDFNVDEQSQESSDSSDNAQDKADKVSDLNVDEQSKESSDSSDDAQDKVDKVSDLNVDEQSQESSDSFDDAQDKADKVSGLNVDEQSQESSDSFDDAQDKAEKVSNLNIDEQSQESSDSDLNSDEDIELALQDAYEAQYQDNDIDLDIAIDDEEDEKDEDDDSYSYTVVETNQDQSTLESNESSSKTDESASSLEQDEDEQESDTYNESDNLDDDRESLDPIQIANLKAARFCAQEESNDLGRGANKGFDYKKMQIFGISAQDLKDLVEFDPNSKKVLNPGCIKVMPKRFIIVGGAKYNVLKAQNRSNYHVIAVYDHNDPEYLKFCHDRDNKTKEQIAQQLKES